jgi:hypothetical protein
MQSETHNQRDLRIILQHVSHYALLRNKTNRVDANGAARAGEAEFMSHRYVGVSRAAVRAFDGFVAGVDWSKVLATESEGLGHVVIQSMFVTSHFFTLLEYLCRLDPQITVALAGSSSRRLAKLSAAMKCSCLNAVPIIKRRAKGKRTGCKLQ